MSLGIDEACLLNKTKLMISETQNFFTLFSAHGCLQILTRDLLFKKIQFGFKKKIRLSSLSKKVEKQEKMPQR